MSVLTSDVIKSAFRRAGILAAGSTGIPTLSTADQVVGLERLNGLYKKWANQGLFGSFTDYYLESGDYEAKEFQRVYKGSGAGAVTVPDIVVDAVTGETRPPTNMAVIIIVDPSTAAPSVQIYDGLLGIWFEIYNLGIGDAAPLGDQFGEGLKDCLALELCDEYGQAPTPLLIRSASRGRLAIASKHDRPRRGVMTEYF